MSRLCRVEVLGLEIRSAGADVDWERLIPDPIRDGARGTGDAEHDGGKEEPLLPRRHVATEHLARRVLISAAASLEANTALPATKVSAPACQTWVIVSRLM